VSTADFGVLVLKAVPVDELVEPGQEDVPRQRVLVAGVQLAIALLGAVRVGELSSREAGVDGPVERLR
jgi:hypothetical protein